MSGSSLCMAGFVWGGLAFAQNSISMRVCNSVHMPGRLLDQAKQLAAGCNGDADGQYTPMEREVSGESFLDPQLAAEPR
jgi:hypothetical protein